MFNSGEREETGGMVGLGIGCDLDRELLMCREVANVVSVPDPVHL